MLTIRYDMIDPPKCRLGFLHPRLDGLGVANVNLGAEGLGPSRGLDRGKLFIGNIAGTVGDIRPFGQECHGHVPTETLGAAYFCFRY